MDNSKKSTEHPTDKQKSQRQSHLRLAQRPHHIARSRKQHSYFVWVFLSIFVATLSTIFFVNNKLQAPSNTLNTSVEGLRKTLETEGIQRFHSLKSTLREKIGKTLTNASSEAEENIAQNIAVYLFPELLPDSDFEKSVAMQEWKPLQEAIERSPRTPESKIWFEEMRANIWNYENPDHETPRVSIYAREVLRIYDELSSP